MKTTCLAAMLLTSTAAWAQTSPAAAKAGLPAPTAWAAASRDGNSTVWERTVYTNRPDGTVVAQTNRYTEISSSLNYRDPATGKWRPSQERISILSDGSAVATNGQHNVAFPIDIAKGAIVLLTPDGKLLQSRPVALFMEDDHDSAFIGLLSNSVGELVSSNEVVYRRCFAGVPASVRYRYTRAGFEQDVVIQ